MTAAAWLVALIGGLGTFLERFAFLAIADRARHVPDPVREALRMIPAAALAALVAPAVLRSGSGDLSPLDPRVPAAILAMVTMWRTRQVLLTLLVGLGVLIILDVVLG